MMEIPPTLNTREVMELLKVRSHTTLNAILKQHGITHKWRGAEGNVYRGADIRRALNLDDKRKDPFYDTAHG